ncbi:MAG: RCC1 domain-containing protein [Acidimicrobiaceae bacterium]|nr:RCC1 domain-containing protein [Acidimicrobiaceae bacterium]
MWAELEAPDGTFSALATANGVTCGIRDDASIDCRGENKFGTHLPPQGRFAQITLAWTHACALTIDGEIACWGDNSSGQTQSPAGTFTALDVAFDYSCAVRSDSVVACWGAVVDGDFEQPGVALASLTLGEGHACSLSEDTGVVCWLTRAVATPEFVETPPPVPATIVSTAPPDADADPADVLAYVTAVMSDDSAESVRGITVVETGPDEGYVEVFEMDAAFNSSTIRFGGPSVDDLTGRYLSETRVVGDDVYIHFEIPDDPSDETEFEWPAGWWTIDEQSLGLLGLGCDALAVGVSVDSDVCRPGDVADLAHFVVDATIIDTEFVEDVLTTRFSATLAFGTLIQQELEGLFDSLLGTELPSFFPDDLAADLWVDDQMRLRRIRMDLTPDWDALPEDRRPDADERHQVTSTTDFTDFGAAIEITAPPADEIIGDLFEWLGWLFELDQQPDGEAAPTA